ncbi:putative 26S proteasome regulatory subunit [Coemansia sp. Benny D115]|nr:putative 26S proteasome regulatory subunit [Coemansia sp. Benny D115]
MERTKELLKQKAQLENELRTLELDLQTHGVGRTEALVDSEGFPRSDIDITAVREIRRGLNYKQNDLKALMVQIEESLYSLHSTQKEASPVVAKGKEDEAAAAAVTTVDGRRRRPFARVSMVEPKSPASEAGLLVGDGVVAFGAVDCTNHQGLKALVKETTENIGRPVTVVVERVVDGEAVSRTLQLVPGRAWGGDGLLGCFILPY